MFARRRKAALVKKLLVLVALAAVAAAWHLLGDAEARRVRRIFGRAEQALRKEGPEVPFAGLAKGRILAGLVADGGCRLEIPERSFAQALGGEDLPRQFAAFRMQSQTIRVAFEDLAVTFPGDGTAKASCDFFFSGDSDLLGFLGRDARALDATLRKDPASGDWKFVHVVLSPIVRR